MEPIIDLSRLLLTILIFFSREWKLEENVKTLFLGVWTPALKRLSKIGGVEWTMWTYRHLSYLIELTPGGAERVKLI